MSRSKKTRPSATAPGSTDSAALAVQANAALTSAHYKDAIEHFKALLKQERRGTWLDGLAAAYAGRAAQLADKGMVKEALALWRTRGDACATPLLDGPYVGWLLQAGLVDQALALLADVGKLPPEAQAAAQTRLAAAVLVASDAKLTGLPADSPWLAQRSAARTALAACAQGDAAALDAALQAISFRSPYRDLRPLLKALALQATDAAAAAAALARVPQHGPFEPLARALRVCQLRGAPWLAGLAALDDAGRSLVFDLAGCPQAQRPLVLDAMRQFGASAPKPAELLELVLRQHRALGVGPARRFGLRLLPHAPQRLDAFRATFPPLLAAEQEQVLALAAESKRESEEAEDHWLRLVKLLAATPAGKPRAALVLRRLVAQRHPQPDEALDPHLLVWLDRSLQYDPGDHATHLRLVRDARSSGDLKSARSRLDAARKHFPEDTPLLQEAVEIALASGAFKKAAGLAKQVLQADPINPRVRSLIGQAHLAHARKLMAATNPGAARRELDEAANWLRGGTERGQLKLLRGLVAESAEAGTALLREALAELGPPLVGALHLLVEGSRARQPAAELLRRAGVDLGATPGADELVALARALNSLTPGDAALRGALGTLRATLQRASTAGISQSDLERVCEALHRHDQADLTRRFAQAGRKCWPRCPVFDYLEAAARYGTEPWSIPKDEWRRLDRVFDLAEELGDRRTATRLSKLLGASAAGGFEADMPDLPDDLAQGGMRALLETMLAFGGEDTLLDLARKQLGKATFDELRRTIPGNKKQFARAMLDLMVSVDEPAPRPPVRIIPPPPRAAAALPKPQRPRQPQPQPGHKQADLFDD